MHTPWFKPGAVALAILASLPAQAADLVISQAYGGGGNSGATWRNDFVELFNRGSAPVDLSGWSLQYASASGGSWQKTALSGSLQPGQYLLIQQAAGAGGSQNLPSPDVIGTIAMSGTAGKLALVSHNTALSCGAAAGSCAGVAGIVDFLGYGSANNSETSPTPALSNTTAALRNDNGCTDSDNNAADFTLATPAPRNRTSAVAACGEVLPPPPPQGQTRIHQIQGAAHRSPLEGQAVENLPGIVVAKKANGFWMMDAIGDGNPATSEGLYVYTGSAPNVAVGDAVRVSGTVAEYRPGGSGGASNLTITQLTGPTVVVESQGNALPVAVIGQGGRAIPTAVIENDASGDVEAAGVVFDPAQDGLDFWESLEGMNLRVADAVASGPTSKYKEIPVLADNGLATGTRTPRGGIVIDADDYNPERLILDDVLATLPTVNVGAHLGGVEGVLDYGFGNYKLYPRTAPAVLDDGLAAETASPAAAAQLSIAAYNVENLDALEPEAKFQRLAAQIVGNLQSPDLLGLMEIQDDNGATNDGVVGADATLDRLVSAIQAAGGPAYAWRYISPTDGQDGGEPGGNIRAVLMFNPARLSFVDKAGGDAQTATAVLADGGLSLSPGRIDPTNPAFANSRKPLAGEFRVNGRRLVVIANHFNSKGGDQPLFGRYQPPARSSEVQRKAQATVVADFVRELTARDPAAHVVVLGDLNDFEFSESVGLLKAAGLHDLIETLPKAERYTYVYEGNAQALDHILVSGEVLAKDQPVYDVVHANAEFADQASDHDPELLRISIALAAQDVTAQLAVSKSGLVYDRVSKLYKGTLSLKNNGSALAGPLTLRFAGLPAGVTLASGNVPGQPSWQQVAKPLAAGANLSVSISFKLSGGAKPAYSLSILNGQP
ncbi:MAG: lamin tail domain-containing protein [Gammaproteobacteria bacterium]|nr:lamin tail domain-containing protein [Gammaproteobacteria bacterium]